MDRETLRKVQLIQLEIAKEVKRVCEENNISYFLDSGTLLGTIRHGGFIPWDDDLDIGMTRSEYEKFLEIAPRALKSEFVLQEWKITENYPLPFCKVRKKGTIYRESKAGRMLEEQGIYIDIFPYDRYGDSRIRQGIPMRLIKMCMLMKCGYTPWMDEEKINWKRFVIYIPIRLIRFFFKRSWLIGMYERCATRYNGNDVLDYYEGSFPYGSWVVDKACFDKFEEKNFEDALFCITSSYDMYLKQAYGEYMQFPPEEERENRHQIIEIKF